MRLSLAAAAIILAVCRIAFAGDADVPDDPFALVMRIAVDYGALGLFVAYLIWDRKNERERRDRDVERWHVLDERIIARMEANTLATQETAHALKELRFTIQDNEKVLQGVSSLLSSASHRFFRETPPDAGGRTP